MIALSTIIYIEAEYKKISNRPLGLKFTMDDHCITIKEDKDKVVQLQS